MDQTSLLLLSEGGLRAFPPSSLSDLAQWCRDWTAATGDGRYAVIAECIARIAAPFDEDEFLPDHLVDDLDEVLSERLPDVIGADSPELGALLASSMREALEAITR